MRALLCTIALLQAGTHARMATPCRAGTDHCRLVNTQKSIRAAADRARKSAAEAKDAVRMSRATSVAREAAVRALTNLVNTPQHVQAAQASLAKTKVSAARVERLAPSIQRDNLVDLALAAVSAADEATQAQVAAAAARAAARASEGAQKSDAQRAWGSGDVRLIGRMARAAEDALAVVEETERKHRHETIVDEALQAAEIVERQSRRAHRAAYEARMTAKHIAFGADDARGRMSAAADSAMTHAVEAAAAAREAKPLGAEASRLAKEAIARTGICTSTERNVSSSPAMCSAKRPRPEGVEVEKCDEEKSTCYPDWNELGFYAKRFKAQTLISKGVRLSHLNFDHLAAFNPSLVELPGRLRKEIRRQYPSAYYIASVRHSWGQCQRFKSLYKLAPYVIYGKYKSTAEVPGRHSSVVLLDRNFCVLDIASQDFVEELERPNSIGWLAEDVKLLEHNGRLLATLVMSSESGKYFQAGFEQRFGVFELVLEIRDEKLHAWFSPPSHEVFPSLSNYSTASQIRNLGLLVLDGRLMFLTFLGLQAELQPTLLPLSDLPSTLPLLGHFGKWLHNNVNPLVIEEKGMFLVVGHEHEHAMKDKIFQTTSWHTYLHYFMLFNTTAPYNLLSRSPAFCFSDQKGGKCDLIQFVSSLTWASPQRDSVVVSYGVNDCEASFASIPLRTILEFTIGCGLDWRLEAAQNYASHSFQLQAQVALGENAI